MTCEEVKSGGGRYGENEPSDKGPNVASSNPVESSVLPHPQKETVGVRPANIQESVESKVISSNNNVMALCKGSFNLFGQVQARRRVEIF